MIKESHYIKLTNKNKISLISILLEVKHNLFLLKHISFSIYTKKERCKIIEKGEEIDNLNILLQKYNKNCNKLFKDGYILVRSKTQTEAFYKDFYIKERGINYPRFMAPYTANNYAFSILEREWYYIPCVEANYYIYYFRNKKIQCVDPFGKKHIFEENIKNPVFDFIKKYNISLVVAADQSGQYTILDYVSQEPFINRAYFLQCHKKELENEICKVAKYTKISGALKIDTVTRRIIQDGRLGIILMNPSKPYKEGECSTLLMLFNGSKNTFTTKCIDVVDNKTAIIDNGKKYVKVKFKRNIQENLIGKLITVREYNEDYYGF